MICFIPKYWALQKSSILPMYVWDIGLQKWRWDKSHSFGWGAERLQEEWDSTLFTGFLLCLYRMASASETNKGQFLPSLLSFAPSHMWPSEKEAKHSSCTVTMHPCEAPRLRRYHWCTAKEPYIWFSRAWVKAFWLVTGEQETARHHLTVFVLSNTFCLLRVGMETKSALVF